MLGSSAFVVRTAQVQKRCHYSPTRINTCAERMPGLLAEIRPGARPRHCRSW